MRLGIGSYTYGWHIGVPGHRPDNPMGVLELLERAAELEVHLVQVADNLPLDHLSGAEVAALKRRAVELDIDIEVGTRGIAPDHLYAYIGLAAQLGSPILRVVIDTADHRPSLQESVDTLKVLTPDLEQAGVTLAIENHDRFTAREYAWLVESIDSGYVGICLDTTNSFGALEGTEVMVDALGSWTVNLHLKDFTIFRPPHQMGFIIEGRPAGHGRLRIPWLLERLDLLRRDAGRPPVATAILELWTPPEATMAQTLAKEDAWAIASLQYLHPLIGEPVI